MAVIPTRGNQPIEFYEYLRDYSYNSSTDKIVEDVWQSAVLGVPDTLTINRRHYHIIMDALRFYANIDNHMGLDNAVELDRGEKAREALK